MTHNTFHLDRANGLQSITPDDLHFFTRHTSNHHPKIFQSVRPGHHCHNHRGFASMRYTNNQLICCAVGFTNKYWQNADQSVDTSLVFISDPKEVRGFYYWNILKISNTITLARCSDAQLGFLCVCGYSQVSIMFYSSYDTNPKLVYDNYMQDIQTKEKYMSYSEYMEGVINKLISHQHQDCPTQGNPNTVMNFASSVVIPPSSVASLI